MGDIKEGFGRPTFELSLEICKGVGLVPKPVEGDYKEEKLLMHRGMFV